MYARFPKLFLLILLFGIVWYALFQARHIIDGPKISLTSPSENIHSEKVIYLEGSTENITFLKLNGKNIHIDEGGIFKEQLVLENGYTIMTLTAEDRFGRATSLSRSFVYKSEE